VGHGADALNQKPPLGWNSAGESALSAPGATPPSVKGARPDGLGV